jgi:hypothetical protein
VQIPPALPNKRPADWWSRNWKWFVPAICAAVVLFAGGILFSVLALIKSSDAYKGAVARAQSAAVVAEAIGTPIQEGFLVMGKINVGGASGKADLAIPIEGPRGKATIYVIATKRLGKWHFDRCIVQVKQTGQTIDLSEK